MQGYSRLCAKNHWVNSAQDVVYNNNFVVSVVKSRFGHGQRTVIMNARTAIRVEQIAGLKPLAQLVIKQGCES